MKNSSKVTKTVNRAPGLRACQALCVFQYFNLINIYCVPSMLTFHFLKLQVLSHHC